MEAIRAWSWNELWLGLESPRKIRLRIIERGSSSFGLYFQNSTLARAKKSGLAPYLVELEPVTKWKPRLRARSRSKWKRGLPGPVEALVVVAVVVVAADVIVVVVVIVKTVVVDAVVIIVLIVVVDVVVVVVVVDSSNKNKNAILFFTKSDYSFSWSGKNLLTVFFLFFPIPPDTVRKWSLDWAFIGPNRLEPEPDLS